ncbi:MAG: hypothetical protein AAF726_11930, partial [Planctomycetota bacterium]
RDDRRKETPIEREKRLHAEQLRALRETAAAEAEANAQALEAAAEKLESIAEDARRAAESARERASTARKRAGEARRRANAAAGRTRRLDPKPAEPTPEALTAARVRLVGESDKHAAATRTAEENKQAYLPPVRARRSRNRERIVDSFKYGAGEAPDMGDLDIFTEWQWCVNVANGGKVKTGHVDVARVSFQPNPDSQGGTKMKWGMRRYNLGDTTVIDCDFTDITKEHGVYDSLSGHGLYAGNTFLRLGGQALQIVYRDQPYKAYKTADNLPYTAKPIIVLEDNHVVDCGLNASKSGFTFTFFDAGTHEFPSTIVVRDCTIVHAWDFARTSGGKRVAPSDRGAMRSPGCFVVNQYKADDPKAKNHCTETVVIDNCLFDVTLSGMPVAAIRGTETVLVEDSCFIARDHRNPVFNIDDIPCRQSGKVILENCVSPEEHQVWLQIRKKRVVPMHCPGKRLEIDVATLEVVESEPMDDPITRLISPLEGRVASSGIREQPRGHVDDMGAAPLRYREPSSSEGGDD